MKVGVEVGTDQGHRVRAQFLVCGTGNLSAPKVPEFDGIDSFSGQVYYTSSWLMKRLISPVSGSGHWYRFERVQLIPRLAELART